MKKLTLYDKDENYKYYKWDDVDNIRVKRKYRNKMKAGKKQDGPCLLFVRACDGKNINCFEWNGYTYKSLKVMNKFLNNLEKEN